MILLLSGSPDIARVALAEKIARMKEWKHLPVDQVFSITQLCGLPIADEETQLGIACECARELSEEGLHMVLTHPDASEYVDSLRDELGEDFLSIALGEVSDDNAFDIAIEGAVASVNEAFAVVRKIIEERSKPPRRGKR